MKFVDSVKIHVRSGKGGSLDGSVDMHGRAGAAVAQGEHAQP